MKANLVLSVCVVAFLNSAISTRADVIEVYADPDSQSVTLTDPLFSVTFLSDLGANEVIAWALDFEFDSECVRLVDYAVSSRWDEGGAQPDDPGVLDLGALAPFDPGYITGDAIELVTLDFEALAIGECEIAAAAQAYELEGFALNSGGLAGQVTYRPASVQIVPEPGISGCMAVGFLLLRRRRQAVVSGECARQ